ncbi:tetratricopeptide repeat [Bacteroidales bacterium 6E]|nr:tetratricopeptide repeat [Bacteroidales bacterium 6E]
MAKKKSTQHDNIQDIESALTRTEQFIEDNQKLITYIVGGIVIVAAAFLGLNKFILQPREKEAQSQMFMAENYFEKDSFNLAINGDGNYLGFLDIIDDYGMTKTSKLAKYYTGVSYLRLGEYQEAINFLGKFKTDDILLASVKEGSMGDAYSELGDDKKALQHYIKAVDASANNFTTPIYMMKAAGIYEKTGENAKALDLYNRIKKDYPDTNEGRNVEKYIARVNTLLGN